MLFLQEAIPDSLSIPALQQVPVAASDAFSIGSLLDLASQAGGFQWPIFGVLLVGLLLLSARFIRLLFDQRAARGLLRLPLDDLRVEDLRRAVQQSTDSLYARLLVGMVELWSAGAGSPALGQEVTYLVDSARASYGRTERAITFLSSTAGGLGLLGTLVGIYVLFSAGSRDPQTIFAGIGIAVISTLLGIVVTIVLELLEVLTHGWASRYLERAEEWATQIRYRLMELGPSLPVLSSRDVYEMGEHDVRADAHVALQVEKIGTIPRVRPGQDVGPIGVRVAVGSLPAEGVPVVLRIVEGGGRFASGEPLMETTTNDAGVVAFTMTTGEEEGLNLVEADVEGRLLRFSITTRS